METTKTLNRRDFFGLAIAGSLIMFNKTKHLKASTPTIRVRPNIDGLPLWHIQALQAGIKVMKDTYMPDDNRNWKSQAEIHSKYCPHGNWLFLPWHRAYLYYFEQICREASGNPDFMLPYWDWSNLRKLPDIFWASPLLDETRQICSDSRIRDGEINAALVDSLIGKRQFSTFGGTVDANGKDIVGMMELAHNHIHTQFIRGNMGKDSTAAFDPIFWLHHANVDKIWALWSQKNPQATPNNPAWLKSKVGTFYDPAGNPVTQEVQTLLSTYELGYRYPKQDEKPVNVKPFNAVQFAMPKFSIESKIGKIININEIKTVVFSDFPDIAQKLKLKKSVKKIAEKKSTTVASVPTLRLTVELEKPQNPEVSVQVFINSPQNPSELSTASPSYVGTIYFFGGRHHHNGKEMEMEDNSTRTFLDATETILKLSRNNQFTSLEEAKVSLLPIIPQGVSFAEMGEIRLISFKFELIK